MIGHRMPECADLFASIQGKIRQVFLTQSRVYVNAASGTGLQEAAVRNCSNQKVLNCVNGAFADRWRQVTEANGKDNEVLSVEWGQPIRPEQVAERLSAGGFDAVTVVHNETSTGVTSPIQEIAQAIRSLPNGEHIMILIDSVSGLSGARLEFDAWDLDVALTSSQKAFALPPGLAFCAVSDRALEKAKTVPHRGYYFDFVELEKYLLRNQTPATPAISLMYALEQQLDDMLAEGMEARFARHLAMRDMTIAWAGQRGFSLFAAAGYESSTVTCINNDRGLDIGALNQYLRSQGMIISNGYGQLKGKNFRIAHMGDLQFSDMEELLAAIDEYLTTA
ncbi:MAG: alanine--glyoxylate aminotransferase family protein [Chloroflexi bacterium]|nr:alanine--glyoxylate aminotransferase family protein [Chloroflexota bacterium]MCI0577622.1 alanine--glyoxylate aminotransferase family protein [Chloroflexota bacterium]MCI0644158.1 alanine--glyoxylate aminotransferase family protein [Chloroflexota bacterium]MCI0725259.1 alanine--glyoxylate aminotransferase family protein [Chloroflexota bacterium]